jgi:hypothetical protein
MIDLTNSLLLLSQYENINYSIHWPKVRIDELVQDVIVTAKKDFPPTSMFVLILQKLPKKNHISIFPAMKRFCVRRFAILLKMLISIRAIRM